MAISNLVLCRLKYNHCAISLAQLVPPFCCLFLSFISFIEKGKAGQRTPFHTHLACYFASSATTKFMEIAVCYVQSL